MRILCSLLSVCLVPVWASSARAGDVCVRNGDETTFLFVADARGGAREMARLAPGEVLCASGDGGGGGVVSVFESMDAAEGCSRLVAAPGGTRVLHRYVSFDRCAWDDNMAPDN